VRAPVVLLSTGASSVRAPAAVNPGRAAISSDVVESGPMWFLKPGCEDPARPGPAGPAHSFSFSDFVGAGCVCLLVRIPGALCGFFVACSTNAALGLSGRRPPVHQGRLVQMCRRSTQPRFSPAGKKVTTSHGISSHATNKADHHGPTRETRLARRPDMTYLIRDG
jgi:hypothetical protein